MPAPTLTLTVAPDRDGKATLLVSLRNADGTQGPSRKLFVDLDGRLAGFIAAAQAIARRQLAAIESPAEGRTGDGDPAARRG
jgi:hypothetical protein